MRKTGGVDSLSLFLINWTFPLTLADISINSREQSRTHSVTVRLAFSWARAKVVMLEATQVLKVADELEPDTFPIQSKPRKKEFSHER